MTAVSLVGEPMDLPVVTLTPSQADLFDRCPLQYAARYVQRTVADMGQETPHTSMGESVHTCLYHFHKRGGHRRYARGDMATLLDQCWRHDGYTDAEQEAAFRAKAGRMCAAYHAASREDMVHHLGHEVFLSAQVRLAGIRLRVRGKLDRLSVWPDGHLEVVDYKTGLAVSSGADLADALAPFLYLLLVRHAYPAYDRVDVSHLYLGSMAKVTIADDHERRLAGKERLLQAVAAIARGDFPPRPNAFCRLCPVRDTCPAADASEIEIDSLL